MKKFYKELKERISILEALEQNDDTRSRISEVQSIIVRVLQFLLMDLSIERDSYFIYRTHMRGKHMTSLSFDEFRKSNDHDIYVGIAKDLREEYKQNS